ncbi:hypothetical protein YC2023_030723 [Brassica napus]
MAGIEIENSTYIASFPSHLIFLVVTFFNSLRLPRPSCLHDSITDINPYKRKDVELNQQTRVENGEKKILIFDTTKWSGSKQRIKKHLLDRSR